MLLIIDNPIVRNAGKFSACSKSSCIVKSILGFFYTFLEHIPRSCWKPDLRGVEAQK